MEPFARLLREFASAGVRFVVIGVWGANYYGPSGSPLFTTTDRDLFLPEDPQNLLRAWAACEACGMELWAGSEPLDVPRDLVLARNLVMRKASTRSTGPAGLLVDLTLVMTGFEFERVWDERREFEIEGVTVPVARLEHILASKAKAGRPKDRMFLASHADALKQLARPGAEEPTPPRRKGRRRDGP